MLIKLFIKLYLNIRHPGTPKAGLQNIKIKGLNA